MNTKINTEHKEKICSPIYNMRLAGFLMQKGFVLMGMKPNDKYIGRNVFYFVDSIHLKQAVQEYLNART